MKFETFKENLIKKYDELDETSLIKLDRPSDREILKIFLSKMVFEEYEMKMNRMNRR